MPPFFTVIDDLCQVLTGSKNGVFRMLLVREEYKENLLNLAGEKVKAIRKSVIKLNKNFYIR